jgi:hypothetical protein
MNFIQVMLAIAAAAVVMMIMYYIFVPQFIELFFFDPKPNEPKSLLRIITAGGGFEAPSSNLKAQDYSTSKRKEIADTYEDMLSSSSKPSISSTTSSGSQEM